MPRNGERGFTMIEILVVLTIVAILAVIGLPAFLAQRSKAQDADAKSAATVAAGALEVYYQDHDGFAAATPAALEEIEPSLKQARALAVTPAAEGYTLSVDSATGTAFKIKRDAGSTERTCGAPGHGGCPESGNW
jgi:prepilin-type N-terminal cleavage/methylation domain-containing protein